MADFTDKIEVINLMIKHEKAIAELYSVFSIKFPECEIWSFLYGEEMKHAEWLQSIQDNVFDGSVDFSDMHLSEKGILISIRSIDKYKQKAEKESIDLEQALSIAQNLENSLIEDHYLDYFTSDNEGIEKVFDDLKADTKEHRDLLKEKREEYILKKGI